MDRKRVVRTGLEANLLQELEKIKTQIGTEYDSQVLRYCLHQAYIGSALILPPHLQERIELLLNSPEIKEKYDIFDSSDFMLKAVARFLGEIESNNY